MGNAGRVEGVLEKNGGDCSSEHPLVERDLLERVGFEPRAGESPERVVQGEDEVERGPVEDDPFPRSLRDALDSLDREIQKLHQEAAFAA